MALNTYWHMTSTGKDGDNKLLWQAHQIKVQNLVTTNLFWDQDNILESNLHIATWNKKIKIAEKWSKNETGAKN